MLEPDVEYIVIQTKKPFNMIMKYCDHYDFTNTIALPHQYYFDTRKWKYRNEKEKSKKFTVKEYLVMDSTVDNFHFSVTLIDKSIQMYYVTAH